jgi:hypothetical protein
MTTKQKKKQIDNNKTMSNAISRVSGAVRVAQVTVEEAIAIKVEALDDLEELKTKSTIKARDQAIKKISKDTKKALGKNT